VTNAEALQTIKRLVAEGRFVISAHVYRDHPERGIDAREVAYSLANAFSISNDADLDRFKVTGPALRPPAKLVCVVKIEAAAVIITVWRRAR
jgi:hypothetical protein